MGAALGISGHPQLPTHLRSRSGKFLPQEAGAAPRQVLTEVGVPHPWRICSQDCPESVLVTLLLGASAWAGHLRGPLPPVFL